MQPTPASLSPAVASAGCKGDRECRGVHACWRRSRRGKGNFPRTAIHERGSFRGVSRWPLLSARSESMGALVDGCRDGALMVDRSGFRQIPADVALGRAAVPSRSDRGRLAVLLAHPDPASAGLRWRSMAPDWPGCTPCTTGACGDSLGWAGLHAFALAYCGSWTPACQMAMGRSVQRRKALASAALCAIFARQPESWPNRR